MKLRLIDLLVAIFAAPLWTNLPGASAAGFYDGKTLRFVVGSAPGGGYDTYTRVIARHISRHIPGNPATIVENMEGAGGLIAANYLYKRAAPDGQTIAVFNNANIVQKALGDPHKHRFSQARLDGGAERWRAHVYDHGIYRIKDTRRCPEI